MHIRLVDEDGRELLSATHAAREPRLGERISVEGVTYELAPDVPARHEVRRGLNGANRWTIVRTIRRAQ